MRVILLLAMIIPVNKSYTEHLPKENLTIVERCVKHPDCRLLLEVGFYEARSESDIGVVAVMYTVINRTKHPTKWPNTISEVLSQKYQFSYRFDGSMKKGFAEKEQRDRIAVIAMKVVEGKIPSPVGKAVFYHSDSVSPYWSKKVKFVRKVGRHLFYQ